MIESDPKSGPTKVLGQNYIGLREDLLLRALVVRIKIERVNAFQKCLLGASHGKELFTHKNKCMENW